jgi:RimJ/RimL family protein N-acetyltransferase
MLRGEKVGLRARREEDLPILYAELQSDVATRSRSDGRPWRPLPLAAVYNFDDKRDDVAWFSAVELGTDELAGDCLLWSIDTHNRSAHLGLSLRPAFRGRGLGTDIVRVLCHYGFVVRGLHRLQVDTLADNVAMIKAASQVGFVLEGTLRGAAWVSGAFLDEVVLGLLASEAGNGGRMSES